LFNCVLTTHNKRQRRRRRRRRRWCKYTWYCHLSFW